MFFKFHVELVLNNSSTLDNLERQRNPNTGPNVYDISPYENFAQVFGSNSLLWAFPVTPQSAQRGNGVVWQKNQWKWYYLYSNINNQVIKLICL